MLFGCFEKKYYICEVTHKDFVEQKTLISWKNGHIGKNVGLLFFFSLKAETLCVVAHLEDIMFQDLIFLGFIWIFKMGLSILIEKYSSYKRLE